MKAQSLGSGYAALGIEFIFNIHLGVKYAFGFVLFMHKNESMF